MSYVDRSDTKMYSAGALLALGGGYLLSRVVGAVAWIPVILGFGSFALLKKLIDRNVAVIATLAALIAQTGWFLIGAIAVPDQISAVVIDLVINAVLIGAVLWKPGYISAALAIAWNAFGVFVLTTQYSAAPVGGSGEVLSLDQRALIAHIVLRVAIIAAAATIMIFKANPDLLPDSEEEEEAFAEA
jgi:hypothetical protein